MKLFKSVLVLTAVVMFIIACTGSQTNNTSSSGNTNIASDTNISDNATVMTNSSPDALPAAADELASARKIYSERCTKCHKEDGTGGVTEIEGKKVKAPNFTSDKLKNEPDAEFVEVIEHGEKEDGMPAFKGKLSDEEIKSLVKFIRREFQGK